MNFGRATARIRVVSDGGASWERMVGSTTNRLWTMGGMSYVVHVGDDVQEGRCDARSSDIPGLDAEASSIDEFIEVVRELAPDLVGDPAIDPSLDFRHKRAFA